MATKAKIIFQNLINNPTLLFVQIFGLYAIYLVLFGNAPVWWWIAFIPGYLCIFIIGISAGYHRYLAHKSFPTNRFVKRLILFFGILSGQGSPLTWVAIHRGYHHRHADTDKDLHSPIHGFLSSYITWMFRIKRLSYSSVKDLRKDQDIIFAHNHFVKIFLLTNLLIICISVNLWLYLFILPAWVAFQTISITTSFNHIEFLGYKNYPTSDRSINCIWLWPFILGDAWHNNHHGNPKTSNMKIRWWELDPTFWIIKIIQKS